jgi:dsDNA-specific endonuclease/ATPase MutS2
MKPDVLKQTLEIEEQRKKMVQPPQFLMQQEGKDPVPLGPNEIINLINGLRSNAKVLMDRNSELEKMVEKSVKFSDPIEQPSNNVQKLKKEVLELEFKLKHSAIVEAELRSEIEMLRKNQNANTNQTLINKIFIDKKKSDPEIQIRL